MKNFYKSLVAVATFTVAVFAAANMENPLYAPAQMDFYSKTGVGWMYKKSDDNLAMNAKDWANETENPILRIYEDFGFGITNWLAFRGAFGYTYDGDIDRSGPHNARLGLNFRAINSPAETVAWDIYADAWLGGISKMQASLVAAKKIQMQKDGTPYALTFDYDNYGNGRWGMWFGTTVGKTFDKFTASIFGEAQITFGNNNNQIKIDKSAKPIIGGLVQQGAYAKALAENLPQAIAGVCQQMSIPQANCNENALGAPTFSAIENGAKDYLKGVSQDVAAAYVAGLPEDFSVDTKGTWDFVAGLKTLYEINDDWSMGGGFTWRHRATNSVEALNITNSSTVLTPEQIADITKGVADSFVGPMDDGVDEFTLTLLGSRQLTNNLQLTLYGEYTIDTAEEKAQLGTNRKAEAGIRFNMQF